MRLVMETPVKIANGRSATIVHDEEGRAHLFYEADKLMWAHTKVPLGIWDGSVRFINAIPIAPDDDVSNLHVHYLPEGKMWFVWKNGDTHRFAVHKDDGPQHELTSPYRLYYAVDTEKLYMNISETWQFIGSPNIKNLEGYDELVDKIGSLPGEPGDGTPRGVMVQPEYIGHVYGSSSGSTNHSITIDASRDNMLIAFVQTRGELLSHTPGWTVVGSAVLDEPAVEYLQIINVLFKKASGGPETLNITQGESNLNIIGIVELRNAGTPELYFTDSDNPLTTEGVKLVKGTSDLVIWAASAVYWLNTGGRWDLDPEMLTIPFEGEHEHPRLGIFLDNGPMGIRRIAEDDMTSRYMTAIGIKVPGVVKWR